MTEYWVCEQMDKWDNPMKRGSKLSLSKQYNVIIINFCFQFDLFDIWLVNESKTIRECKLSRTLSYHEISMKSIYTKSNRINIFPLSIIIYYQCTHTHHHQLSKCIWLKSSPSFNRFQFALFCVFVIETAKYRTVCK